MVAPNSECVFANRQLVRLFSKPISVPGLHWFGTGSNLEERQTLFFPGLSLNQF